MSESIRVPFTRALTVLLTKDMPTWQALADADIAAIHGGETSQIIAHPSNEAYFHRLRRRVAECPKLADKIVVFYEGQEISLIDDSLWPPGFMQELWDEEIEIARAKKVQREKGAGDDGSARDSLWSCR